jgi:2-polyprenyl-3-methyl-5-hydroxy-6-metoxy-1,4-benzoquinol methylase
MTSEAQHFESEGLAQLIPQILTFLPKDMHKKKLLDVGCGPGTIASEIKQRLGAEVFGLDCDPIFLEDIKKKGIPAYACDLESDDFPFSDSSFDFVLCVEVIEHLAKPEKCLKEIARILKHDGLLLLTTPNLAALQYRVSLLRGKDYLNGNPFERPYDRHIRLYTLYSLSQLLGSWFKIVQNAYVNHPPRLNWKRRVRNGLCRINPSLASTIIVMCKPKK